MQTRKPDFLMMIISLACIVLAATVYVGTYVAALRFLSAHSYLSVSTALLAFFFCFIFASCFTILFLERDDPSRTLAWLLVLMAFPVFGFILYLLFGQRLIKRQKLQRRLRRAYGQTGLPLGKTTLKLKKDGSLPLGLGESEGEELNFPQDSTEQRMSRLIHNSSGSLPTYSNWVHVLNDGIRIFPAMLAAINQASHHVHLESYILRDDDIGQVFFDLLAKKAAAGVQVRIITDGVGSLAFPKHRLQALRRQGIDIRIFFPLRFTLLRNKLNYRNHRKLLVVDGRVGFTGGANIGNDYLGLYPDIGNWRDTQIEIHGPAVADLQRLFFQDWVTVTGLLPPGDVVRFYPALPCREERLQQATAFFSAYFAALGSVTEVVAQVLAANTAAGSAYPGEPSSTSEEWLPTFAPNFNKAVQIAASGPDSPYESIMQAYHYAISTAKTSIQITSPYFIPNQSILTALKTAALAGIQVSLLLPQNPDHQLVYLAAMPYLEDLMEDGAKVFLYRKGFIHSKIVTVDDNIAIVGTANMDQRSFALNFEANAIIYDPDTVAELKEAFQRDLHDADQLHYASFHRRPLWRRFLESFCRLLSPLL